MTRERLEAFSKNKTIVWSLSESIEYTPLLKTLALFCLWNVVWSTLCWNSSWYLRRKASHLCYSIRKTWTDLKRERSLIKYSEIVPFFNPTSTNLWSSFASREIPSWWKLIEGIPLHESELHLIRTLSNPVENIS